MSSAWHVSELTNLVRRRYPGWEGCADPRFVADEVGFKREAAALAQALLGREALDELLATGRFDELLQRIEQVGRQSGLLFNRVPARGDLGLLYRPVLDPASFAHQFRHLLYGGEPTPDRLHAFVTYAFEARLGAVRWPFPTLFLFLLHPDAEIYVQPTATRWLLQFMGQATAYTPQPRGDTYRRVRAIARALRAALADQGAADLIDVQSFLRVAMQAAAERTGGLTPRGQVELDVPLPAEEEAEVVPAVAEPGPVYELSPAPDPAAAAQQPAAAPYTLDDCAADTGFAPADLARWVDALRRKQQLALVGPPGTGKTHLARHLARHLVSDGDGFVDLVQFHPSYAYEDFIQGLRPVSGADQTGYALQPGRFLTFCDQAARRSGPCVLIIDEMNRANLARVFGELLYGLEYRAEPVALAAGGVLQVPDNVYLIGTMNSADRSTALVDHALRRRFAFVHLPPNMDLLRHYHADTGYDPAALILLLQEINQTIDDPHYALGITYFLRPDLATALPSVWEMEILPFLEEYFFDDPATVRRFRWEAVAFRLGGAG